MSKDLVNLTNLASKGDMVHILDELTGLPYATSKVICRIGSSCKMYDPYIDRTIWVDDSVIKKLHLRIVKL